MVAKRNEQAKAPDSPTAERLRLWRRASDEELLAELRRVAELHGGSMFTRGVFDCLSGRACAATIVARFGSWRAALERAGLGHLYSGKPITEKMRRKPALGMSDEDLFADMRRVHALAGGPALRRCDYRRWGRIPPNTIEGRLGSWPQALIAARILAVDPAAASLADRRLLENLAAICAALGRPPRACEMRAPLSAFAERRYVMRWGTLHNALAVCAAWSVASGQWSVNSDRPAFFEPRNPSAQSSDTEPGTRNPEPETRNPNPGTRTPDPEPQSPIPSPQSPFHSAPAPFAAARPPIAPGLRYTVMSRDGYRCRLCGAAPTAEADVKLVIDHIVPVAKGGSSDESNLQTLCFRCNAGKGTRDQPAPPVAAKPRRPPGGRADSLAELRAYVAKQEAQMAEVWAMVRRP